MNIKELEERLQIPRANIRYYEREGLLSPQRGENNYRSYSEEDLETLKKIKLLRQLDMPVDTIRAVQAGETDLEEALRRQSTLLANESARLERSRTICRSILSDRVTYAALEPAKYEHPDALPASCPPLEPSMPPVEGAVWAHSPWQRWWARSFDFSIVEVICALFFSLVFRVSEQNTPGILMSLLSVTLSWILVALLEPLLLSRWGTTPGKWLLGLELRDEYGKKLTFRAALWRVGGVFSHGYGFNIPIYDLVRGYHCYKDCKAGRDMPYDEYEGYIYYSLPGDRWHLRVALPLLITALLLVPVKRFADYQYLVPPNRGDITVAEFWENVDYAGDPQPRPRWHVSEDWTLRETTSLPDGGAAYHYANTTLTPVLCVLETDSRDFVTAFSVTAEDSGVSCASLPHNSLIRFATALQGTKLTGVGLVDSNISHALSPDRFDDRLWNSRDGDGLTYYEGPFTFTAQLECSGIAFIHFATLYATDGLSQGSFRFTARMEKRS